MLERTFWPMYQAALAIGTANIVGYVHVNYSVLNAGRPCPFMAPIRRIMSRW